MIRIINNFGVIFAAFIFLASGYGIYEALSYAYLAKIFPLYISLMMFVLAFVNLIKEIRGSSKGAESSGTGSADLESQWEIPMLQVWQKFLTYMAVILILYALTYIFGYPLCITFFIIIFYRFVSKARWKWALVAGLAGLGFLALVSKLLYMDWPMGIIPLPWPLG